jgi:hypothetical protein
VSRTFQDRYYLRKAGPLRRLLRDVRLLTYIAGIALRWLVVGTWVRLAYRRAVRTGRPYFIDHLAERD